MVDTKNFKKWIFPILMFVFCEFVYRQHLLKYLLDRDYLVVNFFENSVLNKTFSFGLLNFAVAVVVLLISKYIFKEKLTSIDSPDKISFKKSTIITFLILILSMIVYCLLTYIIYDVFGMSVNSLIAIYVTEIYMQNKYVLIQACVSPPLTYEQLYSCAIANASDLHISQESTSMSKNIFKIVTIRAIRLKPVRCNFVLA